VVIETTPPILRKTVNNAVIFKIPMSIETKTKYFADIVFAAHD